jgi:thioredoxin reductase (NADPH)
VNEGTVGGQMILTHEIANYPGVENISGYQLSNIMKKQAKTFGCEIKSNIEIESLDLVGKTKSIVLSDGNTYTSDTVILSPGGRSRTLSVKGEVDFKGKGISYCATCDGDFFTDKEIIVVGGGNTALEEAVSLTRYARKVTIVHHADYFKATDYAINEVRNHPKINFLMDSVIVAFNGVENLESAEIKNLKTNETNTFKTDGAFVFIGYTPNTEFISNKVELNKWGEIIIESDMSTNIEGVYAAGDSVAKRFRQVTTAVADGTIAALAIAEYLHMKKVAKLKETYINERKF